MNLILPKTLFNTLKKEANEKNIPIQIALIQRLSKCYDL